MKSITLKSLFFGLFLVATFVVKAQENATSKDYEYAEITVTRISGNDAVAVVYSERPTEDVFHKAVISAPIAFHEAVMKEVANKVKDGWIITGSGMSGTTAAGAFPFYFLKRKKQ